MDKQINTKKKIEMLQRLLDKSTEITVRDSSDPTFKTWKNTVERTLNDVFGSNSTELKQFHKLAFTYLPMAMSLGGNNDYSHKDRQCFERDFKILVSSIKNYIEEFKQEQDEDIEEVSPIKNTLTSKVFIVHGQDEGAKQSVARFIGELDLDPIILHEQANQGWTIIEKIEAHADVGFAVVLLTSDDVGYRVGDEAHKKPRARQNVILELGYFMGKIGRGHVCALYKEGVDIPSDYKGVAYISMDDSEGWKLKLAKEIKTSGISVDMNKVT